MCIIRTVIMIRGVWGSACVSDNPGVEEGRQLHIDAVPDQSVRWRRLDQVADLQVFAGQQASEEYIQVRDAVQQRGDVLRQIVYSARAIPGRYKSRAWVRLKCCFQTGYFWRKNAINRNMNFVVMTAAVTK